MANLPNNDTHSLESLIGVGSEIVGGVAGAAIGLLAAGPAGAVAGGAAGPLVTHTLRTLAVELKQRILGHREEVRASATIAYAALKIQENIAFGQQIRQDGFFEDQPDNRSTAEEIFEGVLLIAQREYQEKKLKFYGNLLANIAFRPDIDRDLANAVVREAENMTYRQMCLISLCIRKEEFSKWTEGNWYPVTRDDPRKASLEADANILHERNILGGLQSSDGYYGVFVLGRLLDDLMALKDIDKEDLERVKATLLGIKT